MRYTEFVHRYKALLRDSPLRHHTAAAAGDGGGDCGNPDVCLEFTKKMEVHMTCLKRRDAATHVSSGKSLYFCKTCMSNLTGLI